MSDDLVNIPLPAVVEGLSFEDIFSDMQDDLVERFPAIEPVLQLESAVVNKLMQDFSYRELILRARINDAAKANLVAFANGSDLDHLAAFYGVARMDGENDERFRARLLIEIKGRSTGGSSFWYAAAAMRADVRIKSVVVYRERIFPIIHVAVLSSENGGMPDQAMLNAVSAIVQSDRVRLVNDTIVVEPAVKSVTNIEADIWLLPNSTNAAIEAMPDVLRAAWDAEASVGFDLEPSWIDAKLHIKGVKRVSVISPSSTVIADHGEAIALGDIKLNFKGYDY